jgi:hypothetical protein
MTKIPIPSEKLERDNHLLLEMQKNQLSHPKRHKRHPKTREETISSIFITVSFKLLHEGQEKAQGSACAQVHTIFPF